MKAENEEIFKAYMDKDYSKCLEYLELLSESDQNINEMKVLKASCFVNLKDENQIQEAHSILNDVLTSDPANSFALYAKGLAYFKESKLTESIESFKRASENDTKGEVPGAMNMKLEAEELLEKQQKSTPISISRKSIGEKKAAAVCEICNKTFAQAYSLRRHQVIHTGERNHKCTLCTNEYFHGFELKRHMKRSHGDGEKKKVEENKKFNCDICQKEFKYKKLMKIHKITHSTKPKMRCDLCNKIMVSKTSLIAHMKSHINKKTKVLKKKVSDPEIVQESKRIKLENPSDAENSILVPEAVQEEALPSTSICESTIVNNETPEWNFFFKSLMHDLNKMDEKQKRKFKLKTFSLIDEILD